MATTAHATGLTFSTARLCRPNESWIDGPAVHSAERKAYTERLADLLTWIGAVEGASPSSSDLKRNVRRLRRMYYSEAVSSRGAPPLFDKLLGSAGEGSPLTNGGTVTAEVLDRLWTTDNVMLGSPSVPFATHDATPVDPSHVLVALDHALSGGAWIYEGILSAVDVPLVGLLTWVGDLASWFVEWNSQRLDAEKAGKPWPSSEWDARRKAIQLSKVSIEDVLGDIDGQVLGADVRKTAPAGLVALLNGYYGAAPTPGRPHVSRRFADFVRGGVPAIPHADSGGTVTLASNAGEAVVGAIARVAAIFLGYERRPKGIPLSQNEFARWATAVGDLEAFAPVLVAIALDFVKLLEDGLAGRPLTWPSEFLEPLNRPDDPPTMPIFSARHFGGYYLQLDDADPPAGTKSATYGGASRAIDPAKPPKYVARLQAALEDVGITCVRSRDASGNVTNSGTFDRTTQRALRHFQAYASLPGVAGRRTGTQGTVPVADGLEHFENPRRYRGPIHGILTPETARTLLRWTPPDPALDPKRRPIPVSYSQLYCPVVMEAWTENAADVPTARVKDQAWGHADVTSTDTVVFARDVSQHYQSQAAHVVDPTKGVAAGSWAIVGSDAGPITEGGYTDAQGARHHETVWRPATAVTFEAVTGRKPDATASAAALSSYRVAASIASVEAGGWLDSLNGWDSSKVSLGLYHWALVPAGKEGELFALLAYFKRHHPGSYQRLFGVWGVEPAKQWPSTGAANLLWNGQERKYTGPPALYGLTEAGTLRPDNPVAVSDAADFDGFRDWHWWYRFVTACRESTELRAAMWDFARFRMRDVLATPWATTIAPGVPKVGSGPGATVATFGDVFTSELAVAFIVRYHVNLPPKMISGGVAGSSTKAALADAGLSNLDTTMWDDAEQSALVDGLKANPPATWADVGDRLDDWKDDGLGTGNSKLKTSADTFTLDPPP